jgi:hypothetical protein
LDLDQHVQAVPGGDDPTVGVLLQDELREISDRPVVVDGEDKGFAQRVCGQTPETGAPALAVSADEKADMVLQLLVAGSEHFCDDGMGRLPRRCHVASLMRIALAEGVFKGLKTLPRES